VTQVNCVLEMQSRSKIACVRVMEMYWGFGLQFNSFIISALNGKKLLVYASTPLPLAKISSVPSSRRIMDPRTGLQNLDKTKCLPSYRNPNAIPQTSQL